jgi:3-methylfumaryl-CoA hydratase
MLDVEKPHPETHPHPDLSDWIGQRERAHGCVTHHAALTIRATLVGEGEEQLGGDTMPHLWHWYAFPPTASMDGLGADGHPKLGGFLPPVPLERRMWAGGILEFFQPLKVGEPLERRSSITNVVEKSGASGQMVFVTVQHDIFTDRGLCVREQQDIVYLDIPERFNPPPAKPVPRATDDAVIVIDQTVPTNEPLLFRYSAITFNAHRIHYDLPYAQAVEKYPGLVVHGPLQAQLLMDAASKWAGKAPMRFKFRGVHPMFHQNDLRLVGTQNVSEDTGTRKLTLCTALGDQHQGMQATAEWEED